MAVRFHVRGELPEEIRMMDSAYRRGVALQKMKMMQPLLQYMPEEDRVALLNSDQMRQLFQDAGIGQLPEFQPPEKQFDWKTYNQMLDAERKIGDLQRRPIKDRMDQVKLQIAEKRLAQMGYHLIHTAAGDVFFNPFTKKSIPASSIFIDRQGQMTVKLPGGSPVVAKESPVRYDKNAQGLFPYYRGNLQSPVYINENTNTRQGLLTPGGTFYGRNRPWQERQFRYVSEVANFVKILKSLGATDSDIVNTVKTLYGTPTRRSLRHPFTGSLYFDPSKDPADLIAKANLLHQARQRPRGETTNVPQPYTPPDYSQGNSIGPGVPGGWGTPPVMRKDNSNYKLPVPRLW